MKVLLVNGSSREKGCTYTALSEVAHSLEEEGIKTCISCSHWSIVFSNHDQSEIIDSEYCSCH